MMAHLNNQFVLYISPSLYSLQSLIHVKLTITRTTVAFQKNGSFAGCVLWKSAVLVLILSQEALKQLAPSM